ncbi:AI-2E family transporter [Amaricoccus macauensis]|uniref:AI-2E family transporter n=1 Tax=Amaricoccus macauensis TaxID=57001 RepID=UPI003C7BD869
MKEAPDAPGTDLPATKPHTLPPRPVDPVVRWSTLSICLLLSIFALAYARDFLMPVVLAFMLTMVFSPVRRFLEKRGIPCSASAALIVGILLCSLVVGALGLAVPISEWVDRAPEISREINLKISSMMGAAEQVREAVEQVDELASGGNGPNVPVVAVREPGITAKVVLLAPEVLAQSGFTLILLYFLLASGDMFYEKIVYVLPSFRDKRRAVVIARDIERKLSRYLFTITVINAGLGVSVCLVMWAFSMPSPVLFGLAAFLLNYIPYIGAAVGVLLSTGVALISLPDPFSAIWVGLAYLALTSVEGQIVTPIFVGRSLRLNTVVVFLSVTLWAWLWSAVGMLVATPLLVVVRTFCEHIPALQGFGHFLSARGTESFEDDPPRK